MGKIPNLWKYYNWYDLQDHWADQIRKNYLQIPSIVFNPKDGVEVKTWEPLKENSGVQIEGIQTGSVGCKLMINPYKG